MSLTSEIAELNSEGYDEAYLSVNYRNRKEENQEKNSQKELNSEEIQEETSVSQVTKQKKTRKKKKNVIYILINPAFNHLIKIGYADNLESRLRTLNSNSGIPEDFHVYATYEVKERLEDRKIHEIIDTLDPTLRYNKKREFFEMTPEKAYHILEAIATINGLQENLSLNPLNDSYISDLLEKNEEKREKKSPRPALTFDMLGINEGEMLEFTEDPSIKVTVGEDLKHVRYNGEKISMSALAQKLLNSKYPLQGPLYFMYKGKRLTELRELREE